MSQYEEANWKIPYCDFQETTDGFTVKFKKNRELSTGMRAFLHAAGIAVMLFIIIISIVVGAKNGGGTGFFTFLVLFGGLIVIAVVASIVKTTISVTPESITIDGRALRRADFSAFSIDHTITMNGTTVSVLGYRYGNVTVPFGGVWKENEAADFAAALNRYLRRSPPGEAGQTSPEALRAARPTDF